MVEEKPVLPLFSKYQKPILVTLGIIIVLGIFSAIGLISSGLKKSSQLSQSSPTPIFSPSPSLQLTPTPTVTSSFVTTPTSTLIPSPTPTPIPTFTSTPTPAPKADLYISEYSFDHPPKQGEAFTVRIGIYNQGDAFAPAFWWEWWPTKYNFACRERISEGIPAHGGRIVNCTFTYGGWANYETKAVADTDNEVVESNEDNNTYIQNVIPIH